MSDSVVRGDAHGRVNLIGEHTDYNGGFVLPAAIPQRTTVELRRLPGAVVRVATDTIRGGGAAEYRLGAETRRAAWVDYVQGVTWALRAAGHRLEGCDLTIRSTVPVGSGLASSAALEIAVLRALRSAFALDLSDVQMAVVGRRAENEFVGAPVGIMDQMACAIADERAALFLDTRTLQYERVPLPDSLDLVVINSGIAHDHAAGDYRTRRAECEEAARRLGVRELRDCSMADLAHVARLPSPFDRRARHVITENARVFEAVAALQHADLARLGLLFNQSHASMRDDFAVSIPPIDHLVAVACAHEEVYGARLTGGGFGGSIIIAAQRGTGARVARIVASEYASETGGSATVLVPASG